MNPGTRVVEEGERRLEWSRNVSCTREAGCLIKDVGLASRRTGRGKVVFAENRGADVVVKIHQWDFAMGADDNKDKMQNMGIIGCSSLLY